MQIFKGIIHNTSRSNQMVAAAYFIFYSGFIFITYKDKRIDKQGYFLPSSCHRDRNLKKKTRVLHTKIYILKFSIYDTSNSSASNLS